MVLEFDRNEVFAPTKNPTGVDSVESCRAMLMERDAKRLEKAGVKVARKADGSVDAQIEISPAKVLDEEDAAMLVKKNNITCVNAGEKLVID
jgi:UDP-N-acetylglucosamine/UDP-N-acetylgalactosamine diphosphorylase